MDQVSDKALLERYYLKGDRRALEAFVVRNIGYMHGRARYLVRNQDVNDVVNASIIRLMDAKPKDGRVNNPLGWWRSILASSAIDHRRSIWRRERRERLLIQSIDDLSYDMEAEVVRAQLLDRIRFSISQLDRKTGDPLVMRYFAGLTYKEIAATMNLNVSTVSTRIARGLDALRESFSQPADAGSDWNQPSGDLTMNELSELSPQTQEPNHNYFNDWNDRWFVYLCASEETCGIGRRFVNHQARNGVTQLGMTSSITQSPCASGYPEKESLVLSMQATIDLIPGPTLDWSSYKFIVEPNENVRANGFQGSSISAKKQNDELSILDDSKQINLKIPGRELVLPQMFSELFICSQEHVKDKEFCFQLFGFDLIDGERKWSTSTFSGSFVGRKGAPDGMHPTYEYRYPNRLVSVWTDEEGKFLGSIDDRERESVFIFDTEDQSRSYLRARS